MSLSNEQIDAFEQSIINYAFPAIYYDFPTQTQVLAKNMNEIELNIKHQLLSKNPVLVKFGLANVVYWGNANAGYQMHRTNKFLNEIDNQQLTQFQKLVQGGNIPTLNEIKALKMPQFSGISFVSKIITFLNPASYCVLDLLISRLAVLPGSKSLNTLKITTQIAINTNNVLAYYMWCSECLEISKAYYESRYRAVDIERGFFSLIQNNKLEYAQLIYKNA